MSQPIPPHNTTPPPDAAAVKALFTLLLSAEDPSTTATDDDPAEAALRASQQADPAVRRAAEGLLEAHRRAKGLLDTPKSDGRNPSSADAVAAAISPPEIDGYDVGPEIGRGGFGVVFAARQTSPVQRDVAIKLLRTEFSSAATVARFQSEAAVLARMNHDGIARVLDAGLDRAGRPFVTMERIRGEPLTAYCTTHKLSLRARVELLARICDAVHHAHQRAVIHRDLKPANILVETIDGAPHPRVIDFGIAKLIDDTAQLSMTRDGLRLGTPRYMSPEQRSGAETTDVRIDVYALGTLLCELLTGQVPHPHTSTSSDDSASRRSSRTARPSQLAATGDSPTASPRELRGDLDRIVLKAAAPDPALRYRSAAALGDDLRRFLDGRPVEATPPGAVYLTRRFVGRHKAATALAAVALASAASGAWALKHGRDEARAGRAAAEQALAQSDEARRRSDAVVSFLLGDMLDALGPDTSTRTEFTIKDFLRGVVSDAETRLGQTPDVLAAVLERAGSSLVLITDSAEGWEAFTKAADVTAAQHGDLHPETLRLRLEAGLARRWAKPSKAVDQEVIALRDLIIDTLGPDHPTALRARTYGIMIESPPDPREEMLAIGAAYEQQGLRGSQGHLEILQYLGFALAAMEDPSTADHLENALQIAEEALGPQHSQAMTLRHVYASLLLNNNRLDEARPVIDRQLALAEPIFGSPNRFRMHGLRMACDLAVKQERFAEMLPVALEYQDAVQQLHGADSIQASTAGHWLGRAQSEAGLHADAAATYAWVVPARAKVWGESREAVLDDRVRWARALVAAEQPEAVAAAVDPGIAVAPPGSPLQCRLILALADAHLAQANTAEARSTVDHWLGQLPPDAPGRELLLTWQSTHTN